MKSIPLPGLVLLLAACAIGLNGCSAVRRSRAGRAEEITSESPNEGSDSLVSTETPAPGVLTPEGDVVRLPPVNSSGVVPASAELPYYYEKGGIGSFETLAIPTPSDFAPAPSATTEHSVYFDTMSPSTPGDIWRLPSITEPEIEAPDSGTTFSELFKEQGTGILEDYYQFYSLKGLTWLTAGVGVGAAMANTGFDEHVVRHTFEENVILAPTHEYAEQLGRPKFLGEGYYTIPVFAIAALSEPLIEDLPFGEPTAEWGQRSFRTLLVGAPPMLALQVLTGASRPGETSSSSHWKPLDDSNGVSGHGFMGAVPFISAAKMSDNVWVKSGLYVASTLPALSRVNDDDHYFSQAFLGWWLAYMAASAVDRSLDPEAHHRFLVYPMQDGVGAGIEVIH